MFVILVLDTGIHSGRHPRLRSGIHISIHCSNFLVKSKPLTLLFPSGDPSTFVILDSDRGSISINYSYFLVKSKPLTLLF